MKTHTASLRKNLYRLIIFTTVCICMFSIFKLHAQESSFRILGISQNEQNPSIVGVRITGTFEQEDIVSIYANENFIKAKVVDTAEAVVAGMLLVENISVDIFQSGENSIVARLERRGSVADETPTFELIIRGTPLRPVLTIDRLDEENGTVFIPTVVGTFLEDDQIILVLNDKEIHTHNITSEEADSGTVVLPSVGIDLLTIDDNLFSVFVRRGRFESQHAVLPEPIVLNAADFKQEEPEVEEPMISVADIDIACATYKHTQTLTPTEPEEQTQFGISIDAAPDLIVSGTEKHEAHFFTVTDNIWKLFDIIIAGEYQKSGSQKILSVISGDKVFIGAPNISQFRYQAGGAFEYRRTPIDFALSTIFEPFNSKSYDRFGSSIATRADLLVIGSSARDMSGHVTVFSREDEQWRFSENILPSNSTDKQYFGRTVAIGQDSIVVGAPGERVSNSNTGAVYVYTKNGTEQNEQKLAPATNTHNTFGNALFTEDNMLFVGAPKEGAGAVYVYNNQAGRWILQQRISAPEEYGKSQRFGASITGGRGLLIIGAPGAESSRPGRTGMFFTYTADPIWTLQEGIDNSATKNGDRFGEQVAFNGTVLVVGAPGTDTQVGDSTLRNVGSIYVYTVEPKVCESENMGTEALDGSKTVVEYTENLQSLQKSLKTAFEQVTMQLQQAVEDAADAKNREPHTLLLTKHQHIQMHSNALQNCADYLLPVCQKKYRCVEFQSNRHLLRVMIKKKFVLVMK